MRVTVVIDETLDEEIIVHLKKESRIVDDIRAIASGERAELIGYNENDIVRISLEQTSAFIVEDGRVYALLDGKRLRLKSRLYEIEDTLPQSFIRINQSCIVNISMIKKFTVSIGASLMVELKCGYRDYVSRRQVKKVKERLGIK